MEEGEEKQQATGQLPLGPFLDLVSVEGNEGGTAEDIQEGCWASEGSQHSRDSVITSREREELEEGREREKYKNLQDEGARGGGFPDRRC